MDQVQVSIPCKDTIILQGMAKKLQKCRFKTEIWDSSVNGKPSEFILYRSIKQGECDIPTEGYWIFERNQFYRNERAAKLYRKAIRKEMKCLSQKLKRIG